MGISIPFYILAIAAPALLTPPTAGAVHKAVTRRPATHDSALRLGSAKSEEAVLALVQGTTISISFEAAVTPHGVTAFTRTKYVPLGAGTLTDAVPTGITARFVRLGAEPASMR
jgi:hypothetical protein